MCARKVILDSDEEDEVVVKDTGLQNIEDVSLVEGSKANAIMGGLPSPTDLRSSRTSAEEPIGSTTKSPSGSRLKRSKTTMEEIGPPGQNVKELYGTKTTVDDLRLREGRRNELWEQALDTSMTCDDDDSRKLKRRKLNVEAQLRSFEEISSGTRLSQHSGEIERGLNMEMNRLEHATKRESRQPSSAAIQVKGGDGDSDLLAQDAQCTDNVGASAIPEVPPGANVLDDLVAVNHPLQVVAVSIPIHDANISQSPIMAPSISQLSGRQDPAQSKPSRKRKPFQESSQADELASEDMIGLPKEQYKPRPSRSRRQNDHVDELVKGIDYSKTVESIVRGSRKGKAKKSAAKRRQTTGCFLGSPRDWDDEGDGGEKTGGVEALPIDHDDDAAQKLQQRSKTAAAESRDPKTTLHVSPNNDEGGGQDASVMMNCMLSSTSEGPARQMSEERDDEIITKPKRGRKPSATQTPKPKTLSYIIEDDEEDGIGHHMRVEESGLPKSNATGPNEPMTVNPTIENNDEEDNFHPLDDAPGPSASHSKTKKKRGRPKKEDAQPVPELFNPTDPSQALNKPPPKSTSKRRKTKEAVSNDLTPSPPSQPLAESPTKANSILPNPDGNGSSRDEGDTIITENVPPQAETPRQVKGTAEAGAQGRRNETEAPSPSKKHHSPISSSKVPLRVGLSRRQRIEPLLRVRR